MGGGGSYRRARQQAESYRRVAVSYWLQAGGGELQEGAGQQAMRGGRGGSYRRAGQWAESYWRAAASYWRATGAQIRAQGY